MTNGSATIVQKLWNYCNVLRDGDELFDHYSHALEKLGNKKGLLGSILKKAQNIFHKRLF
jgi:type I restriction enzyme M protein